MNKTLKPLFACLFSGLICTGAAAAEPQVINIKTDGSSMVMSVTSDGEVLFHHFGGRIDDATPVTGIKSYRRTDHGTDNLAYSTMGGRNFREPALRVTHADGDMNTELRYVSHTTRTLADTNVTRTVIKLTDTNQALDVELFYTAYAKENVITTHAVIRNREKGSIVLHSFYSSSLPVKARSYLLTHLYGAWARESQVDHTLLTHGSKSIESRKQVRTTHTENPAFMITLDSESFDENYGEVIAGALAWSGNFRLNFEVDEFNVLNILAGANPYASDYTLGEGESFTTPEMIYTYSSEGAGGASRHLHDWARNYGVWHGHTYAPTLLNSWEGAYFTFDAKTLTEMIDDAADMGLEMFVLDDGWFGNKYPRNDSNAGLGDWQVNAKKLPEGIDYIASYAHQKGMKFGIWIEPEMISEDSDLYREHPDWALTIPGRKPVRSRNQLVLDFSRKEVVDGIFGQISAVLDNANIEYVKWDMNRSLMDVFSVMTKDQGRVMYDYVLGLYDFLDRMVNRYPDLLIEGCSGGGGRFDAGMLYYTPQIWCSDNSDAIDRLRIQYGTSFGYPVSAMGAHVSAVPNHQTGRITPLHTRGVVAMSGTFGYELDLLKLTEEEKDEVRSQIGEFRKYAPLIQNGRYYRLTDPFKSEVCAWEIVGNSQEEVLLNVVMEEIHGNMTVNYVQLRGLDESALYKEQTTGRIYSGAALMHGGMPLPAEFGEYRAYQYHFVRE